MALFKNCDKDKVEYIVNEQKKEENKNRRKIKSVAEVWPIVLDVTSIDAIGVSDNHLELLLIDENKRNWNAEYGDNGGILNDKTRISKFH